MASEGCALAPVHDATSPWRLRHESTLWMRWSKIGALRRKVQAETGALLQSLFFSRPAPYRRLARVYEVLSWATKFFAGIL